MMARIIPIITNGKAIEIVCSKNSRTDKTEYKDLLGNEIDVNDGNTFVNICPTNAEVEIEGVEDITGTTNTVNE